MRGLVGWAIGGIISGMSADEKKPIDSFRIVVHAIFGAILGAILGVIVVTRSMIEGALYIVLIILGCAILFAAIGAIFGDRFWNIFTR